MRFGILGDANIARRNLRPAILAAGHEIVAIGRRDPAQGLDPIWGDIKVTDYEGLIADEGVDAIYNALPNHLHVPYAIKALEAGKPVLCEKPVALSMAEFDELVACVKRTKTYLYDGYMVRYHPQWAWMRDVAVGARQFIHAHFSYPPRPEGNVRNKSAWGGGPIWDIGCYCLLSGLMLFEGVPELRHIQKQEETHIDVEKSANAIIAFVKEGRGEDQLLSLTCSSGSALAQSVQLIGTDGWARLEVPFNPPAITRGFFANSDKGEMLGQGQEVVFAACDQYQLMIEDFVHAVAEGRQADLSQSAHVTAILSQMVHS